MRTEPNRALVASRAGLVAIGERGRRTRSVSAGAAPSALRRFQPPNPIGDHRPAEALQRQHLLGLDFHERFDARVHALGYQNLITGDLAAQARRQISDGPDRAVVPAALEADRADGRKALCDADSQAQLVAALDPVLRHAV